MCLRIHLCLCFRLRFSHVESSLPQNCTLDRAYAESMFSLVASRGPSHYAIASLRGLHIIRSIVRCNFSIGRQCDNESSRLVDDTSRSAERTERERPLTNQSREFLPREHSYIGLAVSLPIRFPANNRCPKGDEYLFLRVRACALVHDADARACAAAWAMHDVRARANHRENNPVRARIVSKGSHPRIRGFARTEKASIPGSNTPRWIN